MYILEMKTKNMQPCYWYQQRMLDLDIGLCLGILVQWLRVRTEYCFPLLKFVVAQSQLQLLFPTSAKLRLHHQTTTQFRLDLTLLLNRSG